MKLVPFTRNNYANLINWIPNARLNYLWSGPVFTYPITEKQLDLHFSKSEVVPLVLESEGKALGYIELVRESSLRYRLCRVLIGDEACRGKGYGKVLVELAIWHARNVLGASVVALAVFEQNQSAINCYHALGFQQTGKATGLRSYNDEDWTLLYMERNV